MSKQANNLEGMKPKFEDHVDKYEEENRAFNRTSKNKQNAKKGLQTKRRRNWSNVDEESYLDIED